jgi:hypothetical protein
MFKNKKISLLSVWLLWGPILKMRGVPGGECAHHWYTPTHPQLLLLIPLMCTANTLTVIFSERICAKISSVFVNKVAQTGFKYTHLNSAVR